MRPFVVRAAYDASGNEILRRTPQALRRAVSPEVAHTMNHLLRGVVNGREGTARLARVADFTVAGKTGTAQMVNPDTGTYYQGRLVASFVGFLPADDPRLVILVVLYDVPHGHFGGLVAAPVFSEIASGALQRLDVPAPHPAFGTASLIPFESVGEPPSGPAESADQPSADTPDEYPPPSLMTVSADSQGRAPDFRGLSLRSAFALARAARVALEVTGNGYVVRQKPAPGGSLDGSTVALTLSESAQSETESASSERRQSRRSKRAEMGRKAFVIRRAEMLARVSG
jgi:cell division protein FtsI (penicillin-binding protein 3)